MVTSHQGTAGGRADGVTRIAVREAHPLLRHSIDIGCQDGLATVTTEVVVAHVVHHDKDQVRQLGSSLQMKAGQEEQAKQRNE